MLEKNREAAKRCRTKKKSEEEWLKEEVRALESNNAQLHNCATFLRHEVLGLKEECLKYINCGCDRGYERVRDYLLQMVAADAGYSSPDSANSAFTSSTSSLSPGWSTENLDVVRRVEPH
ncbi:hypothetical protein NA57DRAFT_55180 [Rhizodiscina lignyota]|uniref:BZIP domain-containing protein n=1 Tax=Rhizodiscina lignyota TaxID=1504668 RepID=A0A9P4IGF0_9PEZI|nr:hypothetical protein NA57DRAFT_55180 [Rhizodiscina lignyota]